MAGARKQMVLVIPASGLAALHAYAEAGGRILAGDFACAWLDQNGNFAQAPNWAVDHGRQRLLIY